MSELFNNYEQQFGNLSAEITAKICKIPNLHGDAKRSTVSDVERAFDEANELLEQMDLEVREMAGNDKSKYTHRVKTYKNEMVKFQQDLIQRHGYLSRWCRLDRTGRRLEEGYKMCVETEQIGVDIMDNLHRDREVINRSRDRLRGTDQNLSKSSRLLTAMMRRVIQNRIILAVICIVILVVIGLVIYYSVKKKST
ncbi:Vesicle transport through interaction with t-SNAREs-like 1A [Exaiptasia diaphana]|nr:Vesicle transport through interaction with t-SNAREs-like 1A [Exaiptasia diaphana]